MSIAVSAPAVAAGPPVLDIPSLPLIDALDRLGAATGASIGGDLRQDRTRTRPVKGRMRIEKALAHMLVGTGWRAIRQGPSQFRLVRAAAPRRARLPEVPLPVAEEKGTAEIIVVGKRRVPLWALGGDVERVDFQGPFGSALHGSSLSALADQIPSLTSTALGPGRNKLFVRGIADSSLSGETQATLGEYFGEARTNYNAPDPGLLFYDIQRVELLKGPQATLYGAGTLGGVIRVEPMRPDLATPRGALDLSTTATRAGSPGSLAAAMLNLPLRSGSMGVRAVGYRQLDGGYIDDVGRGLTDINRVVTTGGRADLRLVAGAMTFDLMGVGQAIRGRDAQYAVAGHRPLSRASRVAQPFRSDFGLVNLEIRGALPLGEFVSTTSAQHTILKADYDATALIGSPAVFSDDRRIFALNHETRLSRSRADGSGWIVGLVGLHQRQERARDLPGYTGLHITRGFTDTLLDTAAFGQYGWRRGRLLLTSGLRVSYARLQARAVGNEPLLGPSAVTLDAFRILPMAQASWRVHPALTLSLGYREGYREAGVELIRDSFDLGAGGVPVTGALFHGFDSDALKVINAGVAYRSRGASPLRLDATVSAIHWTDVQADRIDDTGGTDIGFLRTANSGTLDILNLDLSAAWEPIPNLSLQSGMSLTRARVSKFPKTVELHELPSIPGVAAFGTIGWSHRLAGDWQAQVQARLSYRGRARLGPGTLHAVTQGDVTSSALGFDLAHGRHRLSVTVQNVLDDGGNLFGYGNPFTIDRETQVTPQRPRSVSVAFHTEF